MTKFEAPSFNVSVGDTKAYRDNWERIFGKKDEADPASKPKTIEDLPPPREAQSWPEVKPEKSKKPEKKPKKPKQPKEV